ncbi:MAG TPA: ATP-binding protein [Candidatus Rifleibacterium sp.]|nr:ATP-binding protein [Candidatus Rifleibacterium sp.]HPT44672.1 ATP-binding protein [Candidatus Rifleibacterium sp.]
MNETGPGAGQKKLETLGALISGITHEINTPMHYLENNLTFLKAAFKDLVELSLSYQQLLARVRKGEMPSDHDWRCLDAREAEAEPGYLTTEIQQALQQSHEGIDMVSRLVLALKDFSHPSMHEFSMTDVNKCVDTVCTISRHEWKRVAEFTTDLARDLPYLYASHDELHQVLLNLVVNAAHAIGEKIAAKAYSRGNISIRTRFVNDQIEIVVADDGPGIAAENLPKIFEPSFTTKEAGKGTGFGLSLVRRIVEDAHGGKVSVESDATSGTVFTIILPHRCNENNL